MKLYYSPGACSLASHIALLEAGLEFELERVDLKSKLTETGRDFTTINAKGYVPALVLDSEDVVTESAAVLDWIASQAPQLQLLRRETHHGERQLAIDGVLREAADDESHLVRFHGCAPSIPLTIARFSNRGRASS